MIDKRVIERQIRKGKLDAAAYRRTLESLPDVSDRVARDTGEEPSRQVAALPSSSSPSSSSPSSSGMDRSPEPDEPDLDDDDEEEDDDDEDEPASDSASF